MGRWVGWEKELIVAVLKEEADLCCQLRQLEPVISWQMEPFLRKQTVRWEAWGLFIGSLPNLTWGPWFCGACVSLSPTMMPLCRKACVLGRPAAGGIRCWEIRFPVQCGLVAFVASHAVQFESCSFAPFAGSCRWLGRGSNTLSTLRMRRRCCGLGPCCGLALRWCPKAMGLYCFGCLVFVCLFLMYIYLAALGLSFSMWDLITQPGSKLVQTLLRECGVLAAGPPRSLWTPAFDSLISEVPRQNQLLWERREQVTSRVFSWKVRGWFGVNSSQIWGWPDLMGRERRHWSRALRGPVSPSQVFQTTWWLSLQGRRGFVFVTIAREYINHRVTIPHKKALKFHFLKCVYLLCRQC